MERYRLLGIEHGGRESASARVVSREPNKWGVFPLHTFNSGDEVVLAADAQATVEALQAQVSSYKLVNDMYLKTVDKLSRQVEALQVRAEQAERLVASQAQEIMQRRQTLGDLAHLHQEQSKQLTQRTAERDTARRRVDELEAREVDVVLLRDDLAQRTAELEAAKAIQAIDLKNNNAYREQVATLQAELERVRGLVKALPKVEGAVVVSNGYVKDSTRCHALFGADEDAALYAALLQHRQGME